MRVQKMKTIPSALIALIAAILLGCSSAPASAQFAQFQSASTGDPFSFVNSGSSSTFDGSSVPIDFSYLIPNGTGTTTIIPATLTLTSLVDGTATTQNLGGTLYDSQNLQDIDITITADSPINGQTNLLTLTGAEGSLIGQNKQTVLSLSDTPTTLNYSSSFLSFLPGGDSYSLAFDSASAITVNKNGYLNSLTAGGVNGSFTAGAVVPEASSIMALALGLALLSTFGVCRMLRAR